MLITVLVFGCLSGDPYPTNEDTGVDTDSGQALDANDSADVDPLPEPDTPDSDDSSSDDVDVAEPPPPPPEPWDCDPEVPLDAERYADLKDVADSAFFDALRDRVRDHNNRGYDDARSFMFEILEVRDDGKLECVYTLDRVEPDGTNLPGGVFNTEHTWPQSRGADTEPQRSDVHHLFPVEMDANNRRANYEFGRVDCDESTCPWHRDGSFLGPSADDDRDPVFEVRPARRGDIARAILYFSLRYEEPVSPEEESVLRQWNCEDPPDDYERARNDDIEIFQQNRNPFIDRPDFVDRIEVF